MNDANNRRVTSVNMPERPSPWRGAIAFAGVAAIAAVVLVAVILGLRGGQQAASPTATATATATPSATSTTSPSATSSVAPSPSPTAGSTYQSPLSYTVQLPGGYRRSDLQSRTTPNPQGDPELLGYETFTTRTPADEAEVMRRMDTGPFMYSASVSLYRNTRNESAIAYAERKKNGFGLTVVSVEPTTVDGRAGAKTTLKFFQADAKTFYTLYVPDGDRMWVVSHVLGQPTDSVPAGTTEEGLRSIVESFRFAR